MYLRFLLFCLCLTFCLSQVNAQQTRGKVIVNGNGNKLLVLENETQRDTLYLLFLDYSFCIQDSFLYQVYDFGRRMGRYIKPPECREHSFGYERQNVADLECWVPMSSGFVNTEKWFLETHVCIDEILISDCHLILKRGDGETLSISLIDHPNIDFNRVIKEFFK